MVILEIKLNRVISVNLVSLDMETLIMHPKSEEQLLALKAIAKAWKINVETSPYGRNFVAMVKKAEKRGNYEEIDPNDVWGSLKLR